MLENCDENVIEEYINFECVTNATGDAYMTFEGGKEMYVADLTAYYALSEEWLPLSATEEDGVQVYKGFMPREDYAKICTEYEEWLGS